MTSAGSRSTKVQRKIQFYLTRIGALPRSTRHFFERADQKDFSRIVLRDGYKCAACGTIPIPMPTIDHIIPKHKGGAKHAASNLQLLCRRCHKAKDFPDYEDINSRGTVQ
jgi:5-methylcytosine-specific restriction endonuclease McrA